MISEQNDPRPPINTTTRLAKRKDKVNITDSQKMSQLEDTVRNIDQRPGVHGKDLGNHGHNDGRY